MIDLSHVYNGPYATFLMAMAGAEAIKVEPFHGEHLRSRGDMGGAALPFAMLNSNKKPVTLNLKGTSNNSGSFVEICWHHVATAILALDLTWLCFV